MLSTDATNYQHLVTFLTRQLSLIFSGKSYLLNRLPELQKAAMSRNLGHAIGEMKEDVQRQMQRIEKIHLLLHRQLTKEPSSGIEGLLQEFMVTTDKRDDLQNTDLALVYYLQLVESVELSGFRMMRMAALEIGNDEVKHLLRENYDEAKASRTLFFQIAKELVTERTT